MNCTYCRMKPEKIYICMRCGATIKDEDRLVIRTSEMRDLDIPARTLYKCPHCRGKLKKV